MQNREQKKEYLDKNLPMNIRRASYEKEVDQMMNPFPKEKFNPKDFEPLQPEEDLEKEIYARARKKQDGKFPTYGLEPKIIREGQMIGMYESKQDIYLMFAHKFNDLMDEVELLKEEINTLKKTPKNL